MKNQNTLDQLPLEVTATISEVSVSEISPRLLEMGLYPGKQVKVVYRAPFGDPIAVDVEGYFLSIRKAEASTITLDSN